MPNVIMIMGLPASGKSSIVADLLKQGRQFHILSRDAAGGKVISLLPLMEQFLSEGHDVVLDNLFLTVESRAPFIAAAKAAGVPIECHWMQTSFEDCQVNALNRMWDRYGQVFLTSDDIKAHDDANRNPNIFPLAAMFAAKKRLQGDKKKSIPSGLPTLGEGFSKIVKVPFVRRPSTGTRKAIIFDYDGTLRVDAKLLGGANHFPVQLSEVKLLPNRIGALRKWLDEGYLLLGVTTQSGIGKGAVTEEMAVKCLDLTNTLIGHEIDYRYCPHHNFPPSCFCRKPQPGLGVALTREYHLNPAECIFVGDMTSDHTFAKRCGFQFQWADDFFKGT